MPKATLTFNLPEESSEHMVAVRAQDWKSVVHHVDTLLRGALKYGHTYKNANTALEAVRNSLWDICKELNLDPWTD